MINDNTTTTSKHVETDIAVGDYVRSFDFESRDLEGERACYAEGTVTALVELEGCTRYEIRVERRVFGGMPAAEHEPVVYPPVNGTPTTTGRVCNGVELV